MSLKKLESNQQISPLAQISAFLSSTACLCLLMSAAESAAAEQGAQTESASVKFNKALGLFSEKKYSDSLVLLDSFHEQGDSESKRLYYSALCHLNLRKESEATRIFDLIRRQFPKSEAARLSSDYFKMKSAGAQTPDGQTSGMQNSQIKPDTKDASLEEKVSSKAHSISVPFRRTRKGQMTVNATLNGRNMEMIFDTGAEECLFGTTQAQSAGVKEQLQAVTLKTVSGPVSAFYSIATIKMGEIQKKLRVCVQDQNMEHGILGAPFLQGYTCTIDNRGGFLRFVPESASDFRRIDSVSVPFELDGAKIIVNAKINDWTTSMCFDTGAFGVCVSKKQAERMDIKIPEASPIYIKGPNNQEVASWDVPANVSLGPFSKRACPVRIMDCEISYPLLGQNFFGDKLFTIDHKKREIRFAR